MKNLSTKYPYQETGYKIRVEEDPPADSAIEKVEANTEQQQWQGIRYQMQQIPMQ